MDHKIKILKLAYGGEGLGMLEGKVCFVEGALPGEEVLVRKIQDKGNYSRAKLVNVLIASEVRRIPECPYVQECGGCQYQHVEYAEELKWKEIQVREYVERNLKVPADLVSGIVGMDTPYRYRNTVTLHSRKNKIGFIGKDNRSLTEVSDCLLVDERFRPAFSAPGFGAGERKTFRLDASGEILRDDTDRLFEVVINGKRILTGSKSFFQNNLVMTGKIAARVESWVKDFKPEVFMDLYAGVGTFSVLSSGAAKRIVCVEENPYSMAALEKNLEALNLKHEILKGKVEKVFPDYIKSFQPARSLLMLDPPRAGIVHSLAEVLSETSSADAMVYLSCHLGTLTRDLGIILKRGRFKIREIQAFDMFPRTKHIEIAVWMTAADF